MELSQDLAINTTQMMHNETTDVTTLAQQHNGSMAEVMVKHTPIKQRKSKLSMINLFLIIDSNKK